MITAERTAYTTRDTIMKMLSDDEIAKVSMAETANRLMEGDEYLDLEMLGKGVQTADGVVTTMGHVLPKKAVHTGTWTKILNQLPTPLT